MEPPAWSPPPKTYRLLLPALDAVSISSDPYFSDAGVTLAVSSDGDSGDFAVLDVSCSPGVNLSVASSHVGSLSSAQMALLAVFERSAACTDQGKVAKILCNVMVSRDEIERLSAELSLVEWHSEAEIRILGRDELPVFVPPTEEVVRITGNTSTVGKALVLISRNLESIPEDGNPWEEIIPEAGNLAEATWEERIPEAGNLAEGSWEESLPEARNAAEGSSEESIPEAHSNAEGSWEEIIPGAGNLAEGSWKGDGSLLEGSLNSERLNAWSENDNQMVNSAHRSPERLIEEGSMHSERSNAWSNNDDHMLNSTHGNSESAPENLPKIFFRMLCADHLLGGIIGKNGSVVKALQAETGANIFSNPRLEGYADRILTISSSKSPESDGSDAQNAVLRVFDRLIEIERGQNSVGNMYSEVTARLLIEKSQFGVLVGRRGCVNKELHRASGARIIIEDAQQVPKHASDDQIVMITGGCQKVRHALHLVTQKLRESFFTYSAHDHTSAQMNTKTASQSTSQYPASSCQYPTKSGAYSGHNAVPSRLAGSSESHGVQNGERSYSSSINTSDREVQPMAREKDMSITTKATFEIMVPASVLHFVYGDNGNNIVTVRQVSGARVVLHDPREGSSEGCVVVSGTVEQALAARALILCVVQNGI